MLGLFREDFSLQAKVMCKDVVTKRAVGSLSLVTLNNWYIVVLATVYTCSAWGTVFPLLTLAGIQGCGSIGLLYGQTLVLQEGTGSKIKGCSHNTCIPNHLSSWFSKP